MKFDDQNVDTGGVEDRRGRGRGMAIGGGGAGIVGIIAVVLFALLGGNNGGAGLDPIRRRRWPTTLALLLTMLAAGTVVLADAAAPARAVPNVHRASGTAVSASLHHRRPLCGRRVHHRIRHVVWIWMENRRYSEVIGSRQAPYINHLARSCLLVTHEYAITHPSAPNYVGATGGVPYKQLPKSDCTGCHQHGPSIFTQRVTWRAFQESMTSRCQRWNGSNGLYVVRHNPATYFTRAAARCRRNDLPYWRLRHTPLPEFTFITPNLVHDMHSGTVASGDDWLRAHLQRILGRRAYRDGSTLVFLMWDEGSGGGHEKGVNCAVSTYPSCHVPMIVLGAGLRPGRYRHRMSHYGALATTEHLLGLKILGPGVPMRLHFRH